MPTIYIQPITEDVELSISSVDPQLLDKELRAGLGDKIAGIATGAKTVVRLLFPIDPKIEQAIRNALMGYELRTGGSFARAAILEDMRTKYDPDVMKAVESDNAIDHVDRLVRSSDDEDEASRSPLVQNILAAHQELASRLDAFDIHTIMLNELREQFGDRIEALMFKDDDAYLTVRGDVDPEVIKKVYEISEKHRPGEKES